MSHPSQKYTAAFSLVILLAAAVRLAGLSQAGIFGVDDGRYILDGLSKVYEYENVAQLASGKCREIRGDGSFYLADFMPEAADRLKREHPFSPKLGYSYLTAALLTATGPWVSACNYIEAVSGILLVAVLMAFVGWLRDRQTALLAGLLLAVSGYSVYYARNPYPQSTASLLFLLAVWAHARASKHEEGFAYWYLAVSGACAGLSFWVHYQVAGALPALVVIHALTCRGPGSLWKAFQRFVYGGAAIAAAFFAVVAFAEAVTYPWILLFRSQGMAYPHGTFLELLWPRFIGQSGVPANPSGLLLFPFFHGTLEGYPATVAAALLLAGAGALVLLRPHRAGSNAKRYKTVVYLVVPFVVPLLIFSLKTMQGARTFTFGLPFFTALLAVAVIALWRWPSPYRLALRSVVSILVAVSIASSLIHIREILAIRSGYPQVLTYLESKGDHGACAAWSSVLEAYLLQEHREGGSLYRYLGEGRTPPLAYVSDWQELYDRRYPDEAIALPIDAQPEATFHQDFGRIFLEVEAFPSYGNTVDNIRFVRSLDLERARRLLVYDLRMTGLRDGLGTPTFDREQPPATK